MSPEEILTAVGLATGGVGAMAVLVASFKTNTAKTWQNTAESWREEAEAQKARADRVIDELTSIKNRLSHLERYNERLISIVSSVSPERVSAALHAGEGEIT
ncbi:hypothetical protein [Streptomyces sp. NBC_01500]|uniref:hypothetical protein n=1 Tax=Streptomyces sp. NBC_01500 TaxID=2903886 RepID=UPI00224E54A2|nr:hypothetical protein [Streptomyces sp. NBC_01500]MCX4554143.1 hypothetical protein [Streptomyces sp. NBC_01500]